MNNYIIWGVGSQGTIIYELLKNDIKIEAFIDNDPKVIGSSFKGFKVISFAEYLLLIEKPTLIISPRKNGAIIKLLNDNNVTDYIVFSDLSKIDDIKIFSDKDRQLCEIIRLRIFEMQKSLMEEYVNFRYLNQNLPDFVLNWKQKLLSVQNPVISISNNSLVQVYNTIFHKEVPFVISEDFPKQTDLLIIYGLSFNFSTERLLMKAEIRGIPKVFAQSGFIFSVVTNNTIGVDEKFTRGHSAIFDHKGLYINANGVSNMEAILNSDFQLTEEQRIRALNVIDLLKEHKIFKYNHQPEMDLNIGDPNRKKILVIDQTYGDQSIKFGWADDKTFSDMLEAAIKENPDADIIVKTHPEGNVTKGYLTSIKSKGNVYKIDYGVNPASLLEYVDKVYVCTSQMGFEALMYGKEVHTFGMSFYSGYGVTKDRLNCQRRTKRRSIEDIFYVAYILCTTYISYETNDICEIEQTIDEIIKLRDEYFSNGN